MSEFTSLLNNLRGRFDSEGIPFVIGGAFALAAQGHPRQTNDLGIMVFVDDVTRVHDALVGDRYLKVNEVTFQDTGTGLHLDIFPVEDDAQRFAFERARKQDLHGALEVPVLTAEGLVRMLLREATEGDKARRPLRLRDIELLATDTPIDWEVVAEWVKRMGYEDAYVEVRAEGKLSVGS